MADLDAIAKFSERELQEVLGLMDAGLEGDELGLSALHYHSASASAGDSYISGDSTLANTLVGDPGAALAAHHHAVMAGAMVMPHMLLQPAPSGASPSLPMPSSATVFGLPNMPNLQPMSPMSCKLQGRADARQTVSHSTVEKQRRDRINSLIDELRELVPPQRTSRSPAPSPMLSSKAAADSAEARRPKHQVLADTISLLKQLKDRLTLEGLAGGELPCGGSSAQAAATASILAGVAPVRVSTGGRPAIKEEPPTTSASGARGSVSSDDHMADREEGLATAATATMPQIPVSPSAMAGVSVDKGPDDIMYVQVRCRDRRGLLSDIVNALRLLPLEIRTAAITTTNSMVRNVFEVRADSPTLSTDDVQNMLHDALFQQYVCGPTPTAAPMPPAMLGGLSAPTSLATYSPMPVMTPQPGMHDNMAHMMMAHRSASPALPPLYQHHQQHHQQHQHQHQQHQQQQAAAATAAMQASMYMGTRSCPPELMPLPGALAMGKRPRPSGTPVPPPFLI